MFSKRKNKNKSESENIMKWLESLGFTHSLSLQFPFCIKASSLPITKSNLKRFMLHFLKGLIYKKYLSKQRKRKDTTDWERRFVEFVVFFENHKKSYTPFHCHILFCAKKKNGTMYTEEEIEKALEYAKKEFAKSFHKKDSTKDISDFFVECKVRQIKKRKDGIYGYDLKEYIRNGKITDSDRFEDGRTLLGVTRHNRIAIETKKPNKIQRIVRTVTDSVGWILGLFSDKAQKRFTNVCS